MAEKTVELVPPGMIIFMDRRINPAEQWPGTTWEELNNELYITSEEDQQLDDHGNPIKPYDKLLAWIRIS